MDRPSLVPSDEEIDPKKRSGPRGGVNVPFPTKLHVMLSRVEAEGLTDIVGWQPHGRCFVIHKPREFVDQIMPAYFRQSKLTSFQRQLNLYGFRRLTTGADRGGYYHEMFLKHKLFLCRTMTRIRIKGTGIKGKASPETEPNFYAMPEILPDCDLINQRIESEVMSAMEEEESNAPSSPRAKKAAVKVNTQEPTRRSKRSSASKAPKYLESDDESPTMEMQPFLPPALITPEAQHSKAPVSFREPGSSNRRSIYPDSANSHDLMDLAPPLLPRSFSNHSLMSKVEYHSDDRITFEGQHFHYLDSLSMNEVAKAPALEPRPSGLSPSRYSSVISLPQLTATISDEDLSYDMCDSGAVSSSSSANTQYSELGQYPAESISFNPSTIFSREGERGSWSIDIDREFLLMES
jgi:hypothetical protein